MKSEINRVSLKKNKNNRFGGDKMLKSITRMMMGFVLVLAIAAASGYVSYLVTKNMISKKITQELQPTAVKKNNEEYVVKDEELKPREDAEIKFDYYMVRLEGENLGIYAFSGGREEFLYNEAVFVKDLSEGDLELLKNGVRLQNSSELTRFMEDFTS